MSSGRQASRCFRPVSWVAPCKSATRCSLSSLLHFKSHQSVAWRCLCRRYAKHSYGVFLSLFAQRALPRRPSLTRERIEIFLALVPYRFNHVQNAYQTVGVSSNSLLIWKTNQPWPWLAPVLLVLPIMLIIFMDVGCVCLRGTISDLHWPSVFFCLLKKTLINATN